LRSAANVNDADWLADAGNGRLLGLWHGIFHTFFIDATNAGLKVEPRRLASPNKVRDSVRTGMPARLEKPTQSAEVMAMQ
jgi:hypothetical protein